MNLHLGLCHGPILNKRGQEVVTSVTNLDIHDIARSCRTFGVLSYTLITPLQAQQQLLASILEHWRAPQASDYNPDRSDALGLIRVQPSLEGALQVLAQESGVAPRLVVTGANFTSDDGGMEQLLAQAQLDKRPIFLLFGTGWGLTPETVERADFRLRPLRGLAQDGYNHLSVRSAVAIYLEHYALARQAVEASELRPAP